MISNGQPWYFVGLFDVLGFEAKFKQLGLDNLSNLYIDLVDSIKVENAHSSQLKEFLHIEDDAVWTADGDAFVFNQIRGAYASDSLLLWSHAHFPEAHGLTNQERTDRSHDPADGWSFCTIPCERFLEACNELMCHSLEAGLPLRGALSFGPAIFDEEQRIFLGQPLIDAARTEKAQRIVGAAMSPAFVRQVIPSRFCIPFDSQIKKGCEELFSGLLLDWPRHWRNTRSKNLCSTVRAYDTNPEFSAYYENTYRFIEKSDSAASLHEAAADRSVRKVYPQFLSQELRLKVRPVRRG